MSEHKANLRNEHCARCINYRRCRDTGPPHARIDLRFCKDCAPHVRLVYNIRKAVQETVKLKP